MENYRAGVNIGGWLSQCVLAKEHMESFITEPDIDRIASWGMDHVRLPFDCPLLEGEPFEYIESGFEYIDRLIGWCKARSLNAVLDMHMAPGYDFNKGSDNTLLTDPEMQKRFVSLWREIAKRYKSERGNVVFELINEIVNPLGDAWNKVARMAVEGIREIDPGRYLLLGGPNYNAADKLDTLEIYDDERIIYNFHFYEPFFFTHQRARWTYLRNTGVHQPYPGAVVSPEVINKAILSDNPDAGTLPEDLVFDRSFVEKKLAPAFEFARRNGKRLYCGEYGAIELADMQSRLNWLEDVTSLLNQHGVGKAYWTYKSMSYSTIDQNGVPVSERLVKIIAG